MKIKDHNVKVDDWNLLNQTEKVHIGTHKNIKKMPRVKKITIDLVACLTILALKKTTS